MKIDELMIGDWMYFRKPSFNEMEFDEYDESDSPRQTKLSVLDSSIEYDPIPLTKEIIEHNGFTKHKDYFYRLTIDDGKQDIWCIEIEPISYGNEFSLDIEHTRHYEYDEITYRGGVDALRIKYVHELQHAFKLCGIDRNITL